jgi:hypothetical protein
MNENIFGITRRKMSQRDISRANRIAKRHGAWLVCATLPGTGWQAWFCSRNYGEPSNTRTRDAVMADIREAGLKGWAQ